MPADVQKQAVGVLHDVRLVREGDLAPPVQLRVVEGGTNDPLGAEDGDRLDRDADVLAQLGALGVLDELAELLGLGIVELELDACVEVLVVLADDHDVRLGEAGAHPLVGLARPQAREEVELLAQGHVDRPEARAHGCRDRALDRGAALLDRLEHAVRERRALLLVHVGAGVLEVPLELDTGGLEHSLDGLRDLRPGAVAGDERHTMSHCGGCPFCLRGTVKGAHYRVPARVPG